MNLAETKPESSSQRNYLIRFALFFFAALGVNLFELGLLRLITRYTESIIGLPIYQNIDMAYESIDQSVSTDPQFSAQFLLGLLSILMAPQLIAGFNHFILVNFAGHQSRLFAKCLAGTSLFWALIGLGVLSFCFDGMFPKPSLLMLAVPLSLELGCFSQFCFAELVRKRAHEELKAIAN